MKITYTKADREKHAEYGAQGGKESARRLTKAERSAKARKAVMARWAKAGLYNRETVKQISGHKTKTTITHYKIKNEVAQ